ncbi:MAG TPA: HD-GYP domain-containing protein [Gaiellaceae bacterium]|nr:HD-GYP domain-containing protein [Gaiellaceae bacterium]
MRQARWLSSLPTAGWAYWMVVVGPAAVAVSLAVTHLPGVGWDRFAVLACAASAAQLSAVHLTGRRVFHPAIVFVVAGALVLSPQQLVLMCVLQHGLDWLKQRYTWYIQPFNIANYVFSALAAWGAAHVIVVGAGTSGGAAAVAGLAAATAFVAVNRLLLAPMLRLGRGLALRETRLLAIDDVAPEFVLALMAVPLAALWTRSIWLAALALAPLVLIHLTQHTSRRLGEASATISVQNESLEAAHRLVVERSTAALEALSATVDARDTYTAGHSRRVRDYAVALAANLGLSGAELQSLGQAALLHDIGKIGVPDAVLLKEGELTPLEWLVMKSHPEEGARIIERLGYLDDVVPAIRHHHERPDGLGYPERLRGDEIPLSARIIHVADALDAMTTQRVYRDAMTLDTALAEIALGAGTDFCSTCVEALERAVDEGLIAVTAPIARGVAA